MQNRRIIILGAFVAIMAAGAPAAAKLPPKILQAVETTYPAAVDHYALQSAHEEPDPNKLMGFVVVEKGGIPAQRADYFVSWEDYDYRGVEVDLTKGDVISTRRGTIYAYLQRGDVMAVAGLKEFNGTIYLKLLSADVYVPEERRKDRRFSRVTVMLGFKFPKEVFKDDDARTVIEKMGEWLKPFSDEASAKAYASTIRAVPLPNAAEVVKVNRAVRAEEKAEKKARRAGELAQPMGEGNRPADAAATDGLEAQENDARMKSLESKIEAAKKQMDEAEKEMQQLKEREHQKTGGQKSGR